MARAESRVASTIMHVVAPPWPGFSGAFFKAAFAEMLRQGFTPGKIGGGNFCRVFDKVTTGHA